METIEVKTPQNVIVTYQLANQMQRSLAFCLDIIFILVLTSITSIVGASLNLPTLLGYLIIFIILFYSLINEIVLNGRSLGKMIIGIKVIRLDGTEPVFSEYILRWVFRSIDIYFSLFSLAAISTTVNEYKQRIGDMLAGTTVVALKASRKIDLSRVDRKTDDHERKYELITTLTEEEAILMKSALYRYEKYKSPVYKEVLDDVVKSVAIKLGLTSIPKNKDVFIKDVIKDYVLASR